MEEFYYQYLIDLGFEREEFTDEVWERQHGYKWFCLQKKLVQHFELTWQPDTRHVELMIVKKGNVKLRKPVKSEEQLEMLCEFLKAE